MYVRRAVRPATYVEQPRRLLLLFSAVFEIGGLVPIVRGEAGSPCWVGGIRESGWVWGGFSDKAQGWQ